MSINPDSLMQMPATHVALRFRVTVDAEDALQGFLMTKATIEGIEEDGGETLYYLPDSEWTSGMETVVRQFASENAGMHFLGAERLQDRDWNAEWEASIEPQWATTDLLISPSWKLDDARAIAPKHLVTIDPKMSFGTGHHETTRLCLHALESLEVTNKTVLDIGTGSGVLAIYALLRGAGHAIGIDTDEWSIDNVAENRALNQIDATRFEIRKGRLDETIRPEERFDIILANIHRNVLVEIAPQILAHTAPGASVVLSGLLIYDSAEVRVAYERAGFAFVREERENEWVSLILRCNA